MATAWLHKICSVLLGESTDPKVASLWLDAEALAVIGRSMLTQNLSGVLYGAGSLTF